MRQFSSRLSFAVHTTFNCMRSLQRHCRRNFSLSAAFEAWLPCIWSSENVSITRPLQRCAEAADAAATPNDPESRSRQPANDIGASTGRRVSDSCINKPCNLQPAAQRRTSFISAGTSTEGGQSNIKATLKLQARLRRDGHRLSKTKLAIREFRRPPRGGLAVCQTLPRSSAQGGRMNNQTAKRNGNGAINACRVESQFCLALQLKSHSTFE